MGTVVKFTYNHYCWCLTSLNISLIRGVVLVRARGSMCEELLYSKKACIRHQRGIHASLIVYQMTASNIL